MEKVSFWNSHIETDRIEIELPKYDSLNFEKAYRIWTDYQVVELIKFNDTTYSGLLVNFISKTNRKGIHKKTIFQKITIPIKTVKKLITELNSENIEILPDSDEVDGYVNGLDGKTYIFEISANKERRVYSYWEPESEQYQDPLIKEVINVRNILNKINSEFKLWEYFVKFRDRLPSGHYSYGMILLTKN
ncbi:hypothetical protein ALE3EI_1621 [Constantimarinum furrinae]|uniref:Uncharacterized protein n=2 Tax=Constantimarinum furrinae TaxID=2562285 RepID=A0A7G8PV09_9FLAO|nr:hypothetical protein ALE3EI_1621 [Constantimarinum furrinae]